MFQWASWGALLGFLAVGCGSAGPDGAGPLFPGSLSIFEVSPPLGPRSGGVPIKLRGHHFQPGVQVFFGDLPATDPQLESEDALTVTLPPARESGAVAVSMQAPDGERASNAELFTYYALGLDAQPTPSPVSNPLALANLDLDRDGAPDLVIARQNPPGISILLSSGDRVPVIIEQSAGSEPSALAVADFSGDGLPDLLVADSIRREVQLLLARSDGTLSPGVTIPVGCAPHALVSAELTGDGRPDLVLGCRETDRGAYLLANQFGPMGLPLFSSPQPLTGVTGPLSLAVADLDGDGRRDVAAASASNAVVQVWLNRGSGQFAVGGQLATGAAPSALLAMDVDSDGRLDLVTSNSAVGSLGLLLGDGAGGFAAAPPIALGSGRAPGALASLDWNGDGLTDLAVGDTTQSGVQLLLRTQPGRFEPANLLATGGPVTALRSWTMDGNLGSTLAAAIRATSQVLIWRQGGGAAEAQTYDTHPTPHAPIAADLTNDGLLDVVWIEGGRVAVRLNRGDGGFETPLVLEPAATPRAVANSDFNHDGLADLAVADAVGVSVLLRRSDGPFQAALSVPAGPAPTLVATAEVSHDGRPDIIVADPSHPELRVLFGGGDGTFQAPLSVPLGAVPRGLLAFDADKDGHRDLVALTASDVRVVRSLGGGRFASSVVSPVGEALTAMTPTDVNLDGIRDLVVVSADQQRLHLMLGQGNGAFQHAQSMAVGLAAAYLVALDLDRDGNLDVATTAAGETSVQVLLGKPDGTLQPPIAISSGVPASGLVQLDIDRDRWSDLLVTSPVGHSVLHNSTGR